MLPLGETPAAPSPPRRPARSPLRMTLGLGALLGSLAEAVGVAFASAVSVVFYFDIRCRKEAFDLEHLAGLVEDEATPTLPAPIG